MEKRQVILAVDDEETILKLLRAKLSVDGYCVVTADDGKEALELLGAVVPDLVLLDITMPGFDGFQVLDMIRKRSTVPVIMLTARSEVNYLRQALSAGADDYVRKPFSILELSARIRAKLRRVEQTGR